MLRFPSRRAPLDLLFLVCCVALTADVLVPEILGNGKTKDYPLWFWAGQQVLSGGNLYPSDLSKHFEFIYPPLPAVLLAHPAWFGKIPLYICLSLLNVVAWWMVGPVLQCDDGIRQESRARGCLRCRVSSPSPSCSTCSISGSRT